MHPLLLAIMLYVSASISYVLDMLASCLDRFTGIGDLHRFAKTDLKQRNPYNVLQCVCMYPCVCACRYKHTKYITIHDAYAGCDKIAVFQAYSRRLLLHSDAGMSSKLSLLYWSLVPNTSTIKNSCCYWYTTFVTHFYVVNYTHAMFMPLYSYISKFWFASLSKLAVMKMYICVRITCRSPTTPSDMIYEW
jgi:hypothetical protein